MLNKQQRRHYKGGPFWILLQNIETIEGGPFEDIKKN